MKIIRRDPARLELGGTPGSVAGLLFGVLVGLAILAACVAFGWAEHRHGGWRAAHIPLAFGATLGLFFVTGCSIGLFGRESLTLDRTTGRGRYKARSAFVSVQKSFEFDLAAVAHVALLRTEGRSGEKHAMPTEALRARLHIRKPRRAVVLDETQNGHDARVRELAGVVAAFLGVELEENEPSAHG